MNNTYITLPSRALIEISGDDARKFLQGIITNDVNKVTENNAIYSCLLTPQGKFLFDFFIVEMNGNILLDCADSRKDALIKRLAMYKLRSNVEMRDISDEYNVAALISENPIHVEDAIIYTDPRTPLMYSRGIFKKPFDINDFTERDFIEYEKLRISLGIPDGETDIEPEKSFPLQYAMDTLNAIDFDKGCYIGQEVTTRSKRRGNVRRLITLKL